MPAAILTNECVLDWKLVVYKIAHIYWRKMNMRGELEDYIGEGFLGLIQGLIDYEETRNPNKKAYLSKRISWTIIKAIQRDEIVTRRGYEQGMRIRVEQWSDLDSQQLLHPSRDIDQMSAYLDLESLFACMCAEERAEFTTYLDTPHDPRAKLDQQSFGRAKAGISKTLVTGFAKMQSHVLRLHRTAVDEPGKAPPMKDFLHRINNSSRTALVIVCLLFTFAVVFLTTPLWAQAPVPQWHTIATESETVSVDLPAGAVFRFGSLVDNLWSPNVTVTTDTVFQTYYPTGSFNSLFPDPDVNNEKVLQVLENPQPENLTVTDTSTTPATTKGITIAGYMPPLQIQTAQGLAYTFQLTNIVLQGPNAGLTVSINGVPFACGMVVIYQDGTGSLPCIVTQYSSQVTRQVTGTPALPITPATPVVTPPTAPAINTAVITCKDGSISTSATTKGACSRHGGIAK